MSNRPSRIAIPVYTPSYDGRYHGRYPDGNKPVSGAALEAGAAGQVAAAGALTTAIRLAGGATSVAAAIGGLSSSIRLAADASGATSVLGSLAGSSTGFAFDAGFSGAGSFADGQDVTITGSGFGTKPLGAGPKLWYDFNNSLSPSSLSRDPSSHTSFETNIVRDATIAPANSTNTLRKIWDVGSPNGTPAGTDGAIWPAGIIMVPDYCYVWARLYLSMSANEAQAAREALAPGSIANLKGWRIWKDLGSPTATDFVRTYHGNVFDWNPGMSAEGLNLGEADLAYNPSDPDQGVLKQTWHVDEFLLKQSADENTTDGYWYAGINGRLKPGNAAWNFSAIATSTAERPGKQTQLFGHQVERSGYTPADNQYLAIAQLYVDESPKRFIVSNKSSWSVGSIHTAHEIQIDTAWSNTSVSLRLRRGATSLSGKYLYYVNGVTGTRIGRFDP